MQGSAASSFLTFGAIAITFLILRVYGERSQRGRNSLRRLYVDGRFPQFVRAAAPLAPVWFVAALLLSISTLLPRSAAVWVMLLAIDVSAVALALSYRVPQALMPRWLREEISERLTPVASPDRLDWVLLWAALLLFVVGNIAGVILIVAYPAPS